jgi:hypothetical protein
MLRPAPGSAGKLTSLVLERGAPSRKADDVNVDGVLSRTAGMLFSFRAVLIVGGWIRHLASRLPL